jgi:hypothetical protein
MQITKKPFIGAMAALAILLAPVSTFAGEMQQQLTSESVIQTIMKRGKMKVGMAHLSLGQCGTKRVN